MDALLATIGFTNRPHPLDAASRDRLGLPIAILTARISSGDGSLRALSAEIEQQASVREVITAIARQLTMQAPRLLWLVVIGHRDGGVQSSPNTQAGPSGNERRPGKRARCTFLELSHEIRSRVVHRSV